MKINILDSTVYNRISAGEVIENPSSVVKELIDNSIDSGANIINIKTQNGGLSYIEINDNGSGIKKSELPKAILPHATSKLDNADDLFSISTLGFRGEALASISEVSDCEIRTRNPQEPNGCRLYKIDNSYIVEDYPKEQGTSVIVRSLFYNTPARYKFLGSKTTEENNIKKILSQYILANPYIGFHWQTEESTIYKSSGQGLNEALLTVYGKDIVKELIPINDNEGKIKVTGYISSPETYKNNRSFQTIVVNGRCIVDPGISAVINNVYSKYLMKHCFPIIALNILIPFEEVDVNVHPTKKEVRFSNSKRVYGKIFNVVSLGLNSYQTNKTNLILNSFNNESTFKIPLETTIAPPDNNMVGFNSINEDNVHKKNSEVKNLTIPEIKEELNTPCLVNKNLSSITPITNESPTLTYSINNQKTYDNVEQTSFDSEITKNYTLLGQLFKTYLIVGTTSYIYFIDQHALHERIIFDTYSSELKKNSVISQSLMIPEIIDCTKEQKKFILEKQDTLYSYGFGIEDFGELSFRVLSVPASLSDSININQLFDEIIDLSFDSLKIEPIETLMSEKLALMACKAAIKGGNAFSPNQISYLIEYFFKQGLPDKCPHGRPSYIAFSKNDLEKMFKRKL